MLVGANAMTYGKTIPSSAHYAVIEDSCVTCHMRENEGTPSFSFAGGHTMNMKWDSGPAFEVAVWQNLWVILLRMAAWRPAEWDECFALTLAC